MAITNLPTAPARSDTPATFITRADAFIAALPTFVTEANDQAAALTLNATNDNSTSSVLIGLGSKTFTVTAAKSFQPGMYLVIASTAAPSTNSMSVQVTSYSGTSLVVNCLAFMGSGTIASWKISQSVSFTPIDASVSPAKLSTGGPTWTTAGEFTITDPSLLGYGTGSGGVVTQLTSKATAVTLNKPAGAITTSNAALAAGAEVTFTVNNSLVTANDIIIINGNQATNYTYRTSVAAAGTFNVFIKNTSAGSLSEILTINVVVLKGSVA